MDNRLKELGRNPLQQLKEWVESYKEDPNPNPIGTMAAVKAMDYLLEIFSRHGELRDGPVLEFYSRPKQERQKKKYRSIDDPWEDSSEVVPIEKPKIPKRFTAKAVKPVERYYYQAMMKQQDLSQSRLAEESVREELSKKPCHS